MPRATPPGFVEMETAERMTGMSSQSIIAAVRRNELTGFQAAKGQPWFFRPEDLEAWGDLRKRLRRYSSSYSQLVAIGRD
jgi:hypothetical protein